MRPPSTSADASRAEVEPTHVDDRVRGVLSIDSDGGAAAAAAACAAVPAATAVTADTPGAAELVGAATRASMAAEPAVSTDAAVASASAGAGPDLMEVEHRRRADDPGAE